MSEILIGTTVFVQKNETLKDILQKYLDEGWLIKSIDLIKPEQKIEVAKYRFTDMDMYRQKIEQLTINENEKVLQKAGLWSERTLDKKYKKFKEENKNA